MKLLNNKKIRKPKNNLKKFFVTRGEKDTDQVASYRINYRLI